MSSTSIRKVGQSFPIEEKLEHLFEIRECIEQGYITVTEIAKRFQISKPVASQWRKDALKLMEKDTNGFTREGIRNIQIGRINYMIETLTKDLAVTTDPQEKAKLHDRIVKYYDSLHRITGLNAEQVLHQHRQIKPLTIVMDSTPTDTD